jgi:hypothetical protein
MAQRFLCPRGHRWQVLADGCDALPAEWIVCPLCGGRPGPEDQVSPSPGDALTPAQRLARASDPDARPQQPWLRRAGLWPVLLGGLVLLVVLPALAWMTVASWQQQAAERQHLREVEEELLRHRDAEHQARERALDAEMRARAALQEARQRELLRPLGPQPAPALKPEERAALEKSAEGRPKDGK